MSSGSLSLFLFLSLAFFFSFTSNSSFFFGFCFYLFFRFALFSSPFLDFLQPVALCCVSPFLSRLVFSYACGQHGDDEATVAEDSTLRRMWRGNGHMLSQQYIGSKALKGTAGGRHGRVLGAMKDSHTSVMRFFRSNFDDPFRQSAVDMLLGVRSPVDVLKEHCEMNEAEKGKAQTALRTQATKCAASLLPPGDTLLGSWHLCRYDSHVNSDCILMLTPHSFVVAYFNEQSEDIVSHESFELRVLCQVETGHSDPRDSAHTRLSPAKLFNSKSEEHPSIRLFIKVGGDVIQRAAEASVPVYFSELLKGNMEESMHSSWLAAIRDNNSNCNDNDNGNANSSPGGPLVPAAASAASAPAASSLSDQLSPDISGDESDDGDDATLPPLPLVASTTQVTDEEEDQSQPAAAAGGAAAQMNNLNDADDDDYDDDDDRPFAFLFPSQPKPARAAVTHAAAASAPGSTAVAEYDVSGEGNVTWMTFRLPDDRRDRQETVRQIADAFTRVLHRNKLYPNVIHRRYLSRVIRKKPIRKPLTDSFI
eukprot:m.319205 g.319205  ORF g.319205 m.319205 type:complete len:536 (-) comp23089_c1_seq2:46-1653(-)